jgi:hypothetical protein
MLAASVQADGHMPVILAVLLRSRAKAAATTFMGTHGLVVLRRNACHSGVHATLGSVMVHGEPRARRVGENIYQSNGMLHTIEVFFEIKKRDVYKARACDCRFYMDTSLIRGGL